MKKVILFATMLFLGFVTNAQTTVTRQTSTVTYKVGDTINIIYSVIKNETKPRYFWLRYQYNNKALTYLSTTFSQGSQSQTFYTGWNNYKFTPSVNSNDTSLYGQYQITPWAYTTNVDWNAGQIAIQRADQSVSGVIASQKYIIKDQNTYDGIHRLDLSYAIDSLTGNNIPYVNTTSTPLTITNVTGNTSFFKVRVLFPIGYDITSHMAQLMPLKTDGSGIDWTKSAIASKSFDASGEVTFTTGVRVGDSLGVWVSGATQKSFMNNIITVSDAYKAFLGYSQTDITGTPSFFLRPNLENKIGFIAKDKSSFGESDAYYLFAYVMGIDVKDKANIPTNDSTVNQTVNYKWYSGLLNQKWLDGTPNNSVNIVAPTQQVDMVFAWGGDLDWSHSSHPDTIANRISTNNYTNSINNRTSDIKSLSYSAPIFEKATLGITSTLENGKVVLTTNLTKEGLAGLEVVMNYDNTKLELDNIIFDSGSTITNFSTNKDGRLTFGSIDQLKTARIKTGTPYKLVFTPKESITNTIGLFYTVLTDAVDGSGKKVNLIVE